MKATISILTATAVLALAACGSSVANPNASSPTGTTKSNAPVASPTTTTTVDPAARAAALATAKQACATAATRIGAVAAPTAVGAGARSAVSNLRTVIAHSVGAVMALPAPVVGARVAAQIKARVDQSFRDLDRAAARASADDLGGTTANFNDAVDEIAMTGSILRRWGAPCDGAPEPSRAGMVEPSAVIEVGGYISQVTAAGNDVWTDRQDGRAVVRVDATTNRVVATIPVDDDDLRTIQVVDDGVWVRGTNAMHRIDPATNRVVQTIAKRVIGTSVARAYVDDQAIWACNGDSVVRASKRDGHPIATIALPYLCGTVRAANGDVWAASEVGTAGQLTRIDETTNRVLFTKPVPIEGATFASIGDDLVWTNSQSAGGTVAAVGVDRATGRVVASTALVSGGGPGVLTATAYVVVDDVPGVVETVDPRTGRVLQRFDGGAEPNALAVSGHVLWVVDEATGELLRYELP